MARNPIYSRPQVSADTVLAEINANFVELYAAITALDNAIAAVNAKQNELRAEIERLSKQSFWQKLKL